MGFGEHGGSLSAFERRTFVHGSVQVELEGSKSGSWVPGGTPNALRSMGAGGAEISRAWFSGKTPTVGVSGERGGSLTWRWNGHDVPLTPDEARCRTAS
jgi:hypothetical protein